MRPHERGWIVSGRASVGLMLGLSACAGGAPSADEPGPLDAAGEVGGPGCVVDRFPLTIGDGVYAYIEPEDLIRLGSSYVVVGSPSYTWAPGTPGDSLPLTMNRHLAARFTLDGDVTLIERPVQDSVGYVRSVHLGGARWGVLFDIERRPPSRRGWDSIALWYAEHDGSRWTVLESVPLPEDGELDMHVSSELVAVGDELVWIAAVLPPDGSSRVVEYTRHDGAWRHRVIGSDWVEASALAHEDRSGLWMVRSGPDGERTTKALRLYHRDETDWQLVRDIHVLGGGESAVEPAISILADGLTVTWRVVGGIDHGAYATVEMGLHDGGTLIDLEREVLQVISLSFAGSDHRWLVTYANEANRRLELRLLGPRALFGAERLVAVPSPYLAFVAALAHTPEEALIVGPEVSSDMADPFVRSLILRLSVSCT